MRQILFRGKRVDNGNWIHGDIIRYKTFGAILIAPYGHCDKIEIIPDTVGQSTGLRDNNSKRIFEGDIVRNNRIDRVGKYEYGKQYVVVFYNDAFCFKDSCDCIPIYDSDFYLKLERFEVVGNIYDNPELLN